MIIEYKVRPVTRYIVTRFSADDNNGSGCETKGEFNNPNVAHEVAYALCRDEHQRLGWEPGDERIRYPETSAEALLHVARRDMLKALDSGETPPLV